MAKRKSMSPFHPLLGELGLVSSDDDDSNGDLPPCALQILNHLLEKKVVSSQSVQSAYESLRSASKSSTNETSETAKQQQESIATEPKMSGPSSHSKTKTEGADFPAYRTRHVALQIYYDGAKYSGLAQNMGSETDQSVEKALFAALMKTRLVKSRETSGYSRCGRTDKGVSAAGQVVALQLKSAIPLDATLDQEGQIPVSDDLLPKNSLDRIAVWAKPKKGDGPRTQKDISEYSYAKILNNLLPETIRVLGWSPVSDQFSARFSATTRTYRYFFVRRHLNLDEMSEALQLMVGKHDFRNFCKMDVEKVYNFERQIHSAQIVVPSTSGDCQEDSVCYLEILGQAFLWHQIRCIASILFLVGRELEPPSVVKELLNVTRHPGKPGYPLAAERPLVLHHCGYPNLRIGYSVQNLWALTCQLEEQWEELVLAAARVRNCIGTLKESTVTGQDVSSFVEFRLQERLKKQRKSKIVSAPGEASLEELADAAALSDDSILTWEKAIEWMETRKLRPDPYGAYEMVHIPLLQRSRGTTYEEKIQALSKSQKRRGKYEENVIKKRKTAKEDNAFYEHMTRQGGTGI